MAIGWPTKRNACTSRLEQMKRFASCTIVRGAGTLRHHRQSAPGRAKSYGSPIRPTSGRGARRSVSVKPNGRTIRDRSLESRQRHRANAGGDLLLRRYRGDRSPLPADVDRHVRPWRAGYAAPSVRRTSPARSNPDSASTLMGRLRAADRLGEKARKRAGNAREGTRVTPSWPQTHCARERAPAHGLQRLGTRLATGSLPRRIRARGVARPDDRQLRHLQIGTHAEADSIGRRWNSSCKCRATIA